MANNTDNTVNRWSQLGVSLIYFANVILLVTLWQVRVGRSLQLDVPFFTPLFAIVGGFALFLVIATSALILGGQLQRHLTSRVAWIWIIVSALGLLVGSLRSFGFLPYRTPFFFWLLVLNSGLLLITYAPHLARLDSTALLKNAMGIGFGIGLTFAMLEILLRVYFGFFGAEADRVAYLYSVDKILEVANRYAGRPYINYGLTTNHHEHNIDGYRGQALETPKLETTYRIFALGGSTTYGDSIAPSETYPAVLEQILHDNYGYTHVEVVNAGVNAYSSFDSLANLLYHVLDDAPDMVIVYHGVNDVRTRLVDPQFYTGENLQRGIWNPQALQSQLSPSVVIRFLSIQLGFIGNPNQFETILALPSDIPRCGFFEDVCSEVGNRPAEDIIAANPPIYFERNLTNIAAIAQANDVDVVFSTWLYYTGETDLRNPMAQAHMQAAVDQQNVLLLDFAAELDVPVINFATTDALNSADYWIDGMHMTPLGTQEQAAQYAAFLIENNLLPPPSSAD